MAFKIKDRKIFRIAFTNLALLFAAAVCLCCFSVTADAAGKAQREVYAIDKISKSGYGSIPFYINERPKEDFSVLKKASKLPSKYDSRSKKIVTSVKDQGDFGSCWAFSTASVAETSLIKEYPGKFNLKNTDFSEVHIAYFAFANATDKLGLTKGDYATVRNNDFLNMGGNLYFSTFSLAKWFGIADESVAPYSKAESTKGLSSSLAYQKNRAILKNSYWVSMKDRDDVKKLIMKYGSCGVSYYHDDMYFNLDTGAYYQRLYTYGNHAVTLVGWDDNYSRDNFGGLLGISKKPSKDGAWLIKNSYGNEYGKDGYIWVSYEDKSINTDAAVFFDFTETDEYDNNYQYDGTCAFASYYFKNEIYAANVFTSKGNEKLTAISFFNGDADAVYKYQIYKNVKNTAKPTSGKAVFDKYQDCIVDYAGYVTVDLPKTVTLSKDEKFSVVIYCQKKGEKAHALCDYSGYIDSAKTIYSHTSSKKGQSLVSEDGKNWEDLYSYGYNENLRIKAFTKNISPKLQSLKASKTEVYLAEGNSSKITLKATPSSLSAAADWKSSDESVVKVSESGKLTAVACGTATVTYVSKINSAVKETVRVTVKPAAVTNLKQTDAQNDSFTFSWDKSGKVTGYVVYRYNSETNQKERVQKGEKNSYTLKELPYGSKIKYFVAAYTNKTKAVNGKKVTETYSSAQTEIVAMTKPKKTTVTLVRTDSDSVELKWNESKGADIYFVYVYDAKERAYRTVKKVKATAVTIDNLKPETAYKFAVRGKITNGNRTYASWLSNEVETKTLLDKVKNLHAKVLSNSAKVKWDEAKNATGYEVYYREGSTGLFTYFGKCRKPALTVTSLKKGKTYKFKVRAFRTENGKKIYSSFVATKGYTIK